MRPSGPNYGCLYGAYGIRGGQLQGQVNMNEGSETGELSASPPGLVRRFGPIAAIIAAALFVYFMGWHDYLSLE